MHRTWRDRVTSFPFLFFFFEYSKVEFVYLNLNEKVGLTVYSSTFHFQHWHGKQLIRISSKTKKLITNQFLRLYKRHFPFNLLWNCVTRNIGFVFIQNLSYLSVWLLLFLNWKLFLVTLESSADLEKDVSLLTLCPRKLFFYHLLLQ